MDRQRETTKRSRSQASPSQSRSPSPDTMDFDDESHVPSPPNITTLAASSIPTTTDKLVIQSNFGNDLLTPVSNQPLNCVRLGPGFSRSGGPSASVICGHPPGSLQRSIFVNPDENRLPAVTDADRKAIFAPLFDKNSKYHEKHGNSRCLSELLYRIEEMTEGDDISKLTTLHGELTNACIRFYECDGESQNSKGYYNWTREVLELIENYKNSKASTSCCSTSFVNTISK